MTGAETSSRHQREVRAVLQWLARRGRRRAREGMARYGIVAPQVFGVSMATIRPLARRLGRDHGLALALWDTQWLEARLLAGFVDEPQLVTRSQMDRWCRQFDNWAVCDSTCLHLFWRTPWAWAKVKQWAKKRPEFVRRAAFALLAALAVHDKTASDDDFRAALTLIETAGADERHFVKKGVNWALRQIGKRNAVVRRDALRLARRMATSQARGTRWIGADAARELSAT